MQLGYIIRNLGLPHIPDGKFHIRTNIIYPLSKWIFRVLIEFDTREMDICFSVIIRITKSVCPFVTDSKEKLTHGVNQMINGILRQNSNGHEDEFPMRNMSQNHR